MPKSTFEAGRLRPLNDCYVKIPGISGNLASSILGFFTGSPEYILVLDNLPDVSDSKGATYNEEAVIGRATPLKTYSQSDSRSINMTFHFISYDQSDIEKNLKNLRALQSAVYPREGEGGAPFIPPPVCKIKCGKLLADEELCVLLKNYSVKWDTGVSWDEDSYIAYKFDVDTTWDVVYSGSQLPGQEKIFQLGK